MQHCHLQCTTGLRIGWGGVKLRVAHSRCFRARARLGCTTWTGVCVPHGDGDAPAPVSLSCGPQLGASPGVPASGDADVGAAVQHRRRCHVRRGPAPLPPPGAGLRGGPLSPPVVLCCRCPNLNVFGSNHMWRGCYGRVEACPAPAPPPSDTMLAFNFRASRDFLPLSGIAG